MIQIAIVEDDDRFAKVLTDYLERYAEEYQVVFQAKRYTDGYAIVDGYRHVFDIILMDIEMGLMDGMEAAQEIRKVDEDVIIIFITNMAQYAIRGYSVSALDYVLKPVKYVAFSETLKKAISRLEKAPEVLIQVVHKTGTVRLRSSEIFWVESHGHRLTFHTKGGDYETTASSLKEAEEKLAPDGFMRASSGALVNLAHVSKIQNGSVVVNGETIFVSRSRKNEFMSALVGKIME